jgi:hypothetical protein
MTPGEAQRADLQARKALLQHKVLLLDTRRPDEYSGVRWRRSSRGCCR